MGLSLGGGISNSYLRANAFIREGFSKLDKFELSRSRIKISKQLNSNTIAARECKVAMAVLTSSINLFCLSVFFGKDVR